jgi:hypothetical protein
MIIYNKKSLANLYVQQQAKEARDFGLITDQEVKNIKDKYPSGFYTPNLFVGIGFFILTWLACLFLGGFLTLMFEGLHVTKYAIWPVILGLCSYAALEFAVKEKQLYRAGIDDALLLLTTLLLTGAFIFALPNSSNQNLFISLFIFLTSLYFTLRFAHSVMAIATCLSLLAAVFFAWSKAGPIGEATMPFVMMLSSFFIYFATLRAKKYDQHIDYRTCLNAIQVLSLFTLYVSGNYYVVQKLGNVLHHLPQETDLPLPFGWFFWLWTILLPCAYIALGIRKKSLLILRTGLILIAAAAVTFRHYYNLLPPEYVLVIAGTILILLSISIIKYLSFPRWSFTYIKPNAKHWSNNIQLEALTVAGTAHVPAMPASQADRFGGGSFGGGGASSDF